MSGLEQDVQSAEKGSRFRVIIVIFLILGGLAGIGGGFLYWTLSDLPKVNAIEEYVPVESSRVYSSDGQVLAEFYVERRTFVPHYEIPTHVKQAIIAIEDVRFYSHPGVDLIGIARALSHDIRAGGMRQGGSTITQQLAKMLFLKPEKSIKRKIREAALSFQIEKRYTKDEILGLYLNQAYFGARSYGIEAASQTYFGKTVKDLTLAEAALLASLPKAPSQYSPFRNADKAKERRSVVLQQMYQHKFIKREQYEEAVKEPMPAAPHYRKYEAPYFVELLRHQLEQKYGSELYTSGYKIHATIDLKMQQAAEKALTNGINSVEKRRKPGIQASLVAIDLRTGHIKAMVGGFDFWKNQFNRATQALRQPGSAFKPFVYLTAIKDGKTSEDTINDAPISFKGGRPGQMWRPKNYDGKYHGVVTLRTALARSLNTATVRLASHVGLENVIQTARDLGIRSDLQPYMPLALGASDVTLLEMTQAYAVFASGRKMDLIPYERIENRDKIVIEEILPRQTIILEEGVVKELRLLLAAVVKEGTATRAKELKRPVYGKTGTTNDYTDAWFIGFDDNLVVGVWVGRDDHKPIGSKETGASAALPIWIEFMKQTGDGQQPSGNEQPQ
ncbi:MAG: PBP1A family penicillin-binding protein [Nitrospirae bacterium]|nr:PBP1A family penicillin-binding protein [Nitrospirota bacterium]